MHLRLQTNISTKGTKFVTKRKFGKILPHFNSLEARALNYSHI